MMSQTKSSFKADKFRNEGNTHFQRKQFLEALEFYNKSLCFALPASPQIGLAYANRSAVYIEAKLYQKCLDNIELAREHGYQKLDKLKKREEKCKNLAKNHVEDPDKNPWNFFKLSYPANEKLPFIVNCLELRENKKYGRYIITNTELKTGDIIAIEEPFSCHLREDEYFKRCANCLKSNMLSLIPCELSCTYTMYCSNDCREEHESLIHKFPSKFRCNESVSPGVFESATKLVMKAVKIAGSIDKLRGLVSDTTSRTVFDFDFSNRKDPMYKINMLLAVKSLAKTRDAWDKFFIFWKDLFLFEPFKSLATSQQDRDFIFDFFKKQLSLHNSNEYGMKEHTRKIVLDGANVIFDHPIGGGLFPFASLLNHSCDANVAYVAVENKLCFHARRPIAAGDQLFTIYSMGFPVHSLAQRQQQLMLLYKFKCDCLACVNNYPLLVELIRKDRKFVEPYHGTKTVRDAIAQFKSSCRYIEKNFKNHPCYETTTMMVQMSHLLHQISKIRVDNLETDLFAAGTSTLMKM